MELLVLIIPLISLLVAAGAIYLQIQGNKQIIRIQKQANELEALLSELENDISKLDELFSMVQHTMNNLEKFVEE